MSQQNEQDLAGDAGRGFPVGSTTQKTSVLSRRRLLQRGAGVAPVALTLASKPVLATTTCTSGSALASLNVSGHVRGGLSCSGRTPGYWKQSQWFSQWPIPYSPTTAKTPIKDKTTLFSQCFSPSLAVDDTLLNLMKSSASGGEAALVCHICAALLNAAKGWNSTFMTVAQVKAIWTQYKSLGYWAPGNGVKLYVDTTEVNGKLVTTGESAGGITQWLKNNMPL